MPQSINDSPKYFTVGIRCSLFIYNMLVFMDKTLILVSLDHSTILIVVPMAVGKVQALYFVGCSQEGLLLCNSNSWWYLIGDSGTWQTQKTTKLCNSEIVVFWVLLYVFYLFQTFETFLLHRCNFNGLFFISITYPCQQALIFNNHIYLALILNIL